MAPELFEYSFDEELGGTWPDRLAAVGPHEGLLRHAVEQLLDVAAPTQHSGVWERVLAPQMVGQLVTALDTGAEADGEFYSQRPRLPEVIQKWSEVLYRGLEHGNAKLLMHQKIGKMRFLMCHGTTQEIVGRFDVESVAS